MMLSLISCTEPTDSTPAAGLNDFTAVKNVEWAKPNGISLTMDIYSPKTGKQKYPVLVIVHGGGWLINNNSTMDSMSVYIVRHSEYVVCNINYRLLGDNGNTTTMNRMIEDVMGAVAWIKDNVGAYGGDSSLVAITGDSAGGHLAAMLVLCGNKLESDGFSGVTLGFRPTYLPAGKTAEDLARQDRLAVKAAIFSYGAFDIYSSCLAGMETGSNIFWLLSGNPPRGIFGDTITVQKNPEYYYAVSPVRSIPQSSLRKLPPMLCTVGSRDNLVMPASVLAFVKALKDAGHSTEYWEYEGRPHAFLDSQKNVFVGTEFGKDAPAALDTMIKFLDAAFAK
jgi:acetyl esterase/lipase